VDLDNGWTYLSPLTSANGRNGYLTNGHLCYALGPPDQAFCATLLSLPPDQQNSEMGDWIRRTNPTLVPVPRDAARTSAAPAPSLAPSPPPSPTSATSFFPPTRGEDTPPPDTATEEEADRAVDSYFSNLTPQTLAEESAELDPRPSEGTVMDFGPKGLSIINGDYNVFTFHIAMPPSDATADQLQSLEARLSTRFEAFLQRANSSAGDMPAVLIFYEVLSDDRAHMSTLSERAVRVLSLTGRLKHLMLLPVRRGALLHPKTYLPLAMMRLYNGARLKSVSDEKAVGWILQAAQTHFTKRSLINRTLNLFAGLPVGPSPPAHRSPEEVRAEEEAWATWQTQTLNAVVTHIKRERDFNVEVIRRCGRAYREEQQAKVLQRRKREDEEAANAPAPQPQQPLEEERPRQRRRVDPVALAMSVTEMARKGFSYITTRPGVRRFLGLPVAVEGAHVGMMPAGAGEFENDPDL
jgi:hypothetical protein